MKEYSVLKELDSTNNNNLFLAINNSNNKKFILKSSKNSYTNENERIKLENEFNILKKLNHEHIVSAHEIIKENNKTYLVKEYFEGTLLKKIIKKRKITLKDFFFYGIQICEVLAYIHKKGIIHSNLSTSSILINESTKKAKIIDFSYATNSSSKLIEQFKEDGIYKAPEQSGRISYNINNSTDIYSLGTIFYEMLIGSSIFKTEDTSILSHNLVARQIKKLNELDDTIPLAVSELINKMMIKNPSDRYSSINSVLADLKFLQKQTDISKLKDFKVDKIGKFVHLHKVEHLYGRQKDISQLNNAIENFRSDKSTFFCISGSSGIGKSTIINHLLKNSSDKFAYIAKVKIDKYKQNKPFEILYTMLKTLTKQLLTLEETKLLKWKNKILEVLDDNAQIIIDVIPELEVIIGSQQKAQTLSPNESKIRFNTLLFKYLQLFCNEKKPLCIFLDDMQWADKITLEWLESEIIEQNNIFMIITYRQNEVKENDPLDLALNKIKSQNINFQNIKLFPLTTDHIYELISSTIELKESREIATIIYNKTSGNPLFVVQFLKQLQQNELIYFDYNTLEWKCNINEIKQLKISNNIIEVLTNRINKLNNDLKNFLQIASCIGSRFDIELLKNLIDNENFDTLLVLAIQDDWIIEEKSHYCFSHDRIQQALYNSLDETSLKNTHLSIGYAILDDTKDDTNLITAVSHLNKAKDLLKSSQQQNLLGELNFSAAKNAKRGGDFSLALQFMDNVFDLLENLQENKEYTDILKEYALCNHLCHNEKKAIEYYKKAIESTNSNIEKASIYELMINFYSDYSKFNKAYQVGKQALKTLNINIPNSFNKAKFILEFLSLKTRLKKYTTKELLNLKEIEKDEIKAIIRVLSATLKVAYQLDPQLCVSLSMKLINLCLKHGNMKESVIGYMVFGVIFQGGILGNHKIGYDYSKLSLNMIKKYNNSAQYSEVQFVCGYFANSWIKPAKNTEKKWYKAYQKGLEVGDWFHSGCSAAGIIQSQFMRGVNLDSILDEINNLENKLLNIKAKEQLGAILSVKQSIKNLKKQTFNIDSISDKEFDEKEYKDSLKKYQSLHFAHYYYINKMIVLYINEKYDEAFELSLKSDKFNIYSNGMLHNTEHLFYKALIYSKQYPKTDGIKKIKQKFIIKDIYKKFHKYCKECEENFIARKYILYAEILKLDDNIMLALNYYEKAIQAAEIYGQIHLSAIANRLISEIYKEKNQLKVSRLYTTEAIKQFRYWGMNNNIEKDSQLNIHKEQNLDIQTLMKAVEVITKEQRLSILLKSMIKIIIENAGASHGVILLKNDNKLLVQAEASLDSDILQVMQNLDYNESDTIEHNIVNYVLRTKETIIIDNLENDSIFNQQNSKRLKQIKAVLCAPIILQGKLKGIIYLENSMIPEVFTEDKSELIKHLSGQIAISIENAFIYDNLEKKVEERTKDLDIKNEELEKQNIKLQEQNKQILELNKNIIEENKQRKKAEEKLNNAIKELDILAITDSLTKLNNRRSFDDYLQKECSRVQRNEEYFSLIMCDVDYFKAYNDHYGHLQGDVCLKQIALVFKECLQRPIDFVSRYGGEEFAIILPNTNKDEAVVICKNIQKRLQDRKIAHEKSDVSKYVTLSMGIAQSDELNFCTMDGIIKLADNALYKAKEKGRNQII